MGVECIEHHFWLMLIPTIMHSTCHVVLVQLPLHSQLTLLQDIQMHLLWLGRLHLQLSSSSPSFVHYFDLPPFDSPILHAFFPYPPSLSLSIHICVCVHVCMCVSFLRCSALMFHYGHTSVKTNSKFYSRIIERLGKAIDAKLQHDRKARTSGIIVNCPTCPTDTLLHIQAALNCDIICVLEQERLVNELQKSLSTAKVEGVKILKIPKSGGVVPLEADAKQQHLQQRIRQYFYGVFQYYPLMPHTLSIPFSILRIFKVGAPEVPLDCLPIGATRSEHELELEPILRFSVDLQHRVLSVIDCEKTATSDQIKYSSVLGFVVIQGHDAERDSLKLMSPAAARLPSTVLLLHETSFMDTS
eukprot:m.86231 g.86231  ORF g.86231 m.86231 type:complete len:358 (+) comp14459_c0_seq3:469-1542(+)